MQPQEIPQNVGGKASRFPYWVMLCVMAPLFITNVFHLLHVSSFDSLFTQFIFDIGFLSIAAAYGFGGTQWVLERQRTAGLPVYAAVAVGVLSFLFWRERLFLYQPVLAMMDKPSTYTEMWQIRIALLLPDYVILALLTLFFIWLLFRLLRGRGQPEVGAADLRGRSILISGLFAWAWAAAVLSVAVSKDGGLSRSLEFSETGDFLVILGGYLFVVVLFALPAFLGAVFGLPANMPVARVRRLWVTSTLAMLVSAAVWYAVFYLALQVNDRLLDFYRMSFSSLWWLALVILLWQVAATLLCRLIVRALMRPR